MSDVYSFTTTERDAYLERVVAEASKETNVIMLTERSTEPNVDGFNILVLVNMDFFMNQASKYPTERLFNKSLGDHLFDLFSKSSDSLLFTKEDHSAIPDGWFLVTSDSLTKDEAANARRALKAELNRLENLATNRTVRVEVETLV